MCIDHILEGVQENGRKRIAIVIMGSSASRERVRLDDAPAFHHSPCCIQLWVSNHRGCAHRSSSSGPHHLAASQTVESRAQASIPRCQGLYMQEQKWQIEQPQL